MGLIKEPRDSYEEDLCPHDKEGTPWFNIALYSYEDAEGIPIAKLRADGDPPMRIIVNKGLLKLFPPDSIFLDVLDYSYCWCDSDGLADKGSVMFPANTTTAGYVAVETHAERVTRNGEPYVEVPPGKGGAYWNTNGEDFIKISFPELITASVAEWSAKISYGSRCQNLTDQQTLGVIHITNMTVKIHPGGWTQIWIPKGKSNSSWLEKQWRFQ